ncbi:MAG: hypothetical protein HYT89_02960, partial [Candidatus Omnitrophica bacterium]|nr:hypothetical protein [Candidatus Omnitrophota bacterium]
LAIESMTIDPVPGTNQTKIDLKANGKISTVEVWVKAVDIDKYPENMRADLDFKRPPVLIDKDTATLMIGYAVDGIEYEYTLIVVGNGKLTPTKRVVLPNAKAPVASVTRTPAAAVTNASKISFDLKADEPSVFFVRLEKDGAPVYEGSPAEPDKFERTFPQDGSQDGLYTLKVTAQDLGGLKQEIPALSSWRLDTKAPEAAQFTFDLVNEPGFGKAFVKADEKLSKAEFHYRKIGAPQEPLSIVKGDLVSPETEFLAQGLEEGAQYDIWMTLWDDLNNQADTAHRVVEIKKVDSARKPPAIEFFSPVFAEAEDYRLLYTVDGVTEPRDERLSSKLNLLTVVKNNSAGKTVAHFPVIVGNLDPPARPSFSMSMSLNAPDGEVRLLDASFSGAGLLENGWVESKDNGFYRLEGGKLVEEIGPDGSRVFFDAEGRVHSKIRGLAVTWFAYEYDAQGRLLRILATNEKGVAVLDANGKLESIVDRKGSRFLFQEGVLEKAELGGRAYEYAVTAEGGGFKSVLKDSDPPADPAIPKSLSYDGARRLTGLLTGNDTTLRLNSFGIVTSARNSNGEETTYDLGDGPFGAAGMVWAVRSGVTRRYGADGSLVQVTGEDGTLFFVDKEKVAEMRMPDGTLYQKLAYDAQKKLSGGEILLPTGRRIAFDSKLPQKIEDPDGLVLTFLNGRRDRLTTPEGLIYQFRSDIGPDGKETNAWADLIEFGTSAGERVFVSDSRINAVEKSNGPSVRRTEFQYDVAGNVLTTTVKDGGVLQAAFEHQTDAGAIRIKNQQGSVREYDRNGAPVGLTTARGEEYVFHSVRQENGETGWEQELVRIRQGSQKTTDYEEGAPVSIQLAEGGKTFRIGDIRLDAARSFAGAEVSDSDGNVSLFESGVLKETLLRSGDKREFENGLLRRVLSASFEPAVFEYDKAASDAIEAIRVRDALGERTFSPEGRLLSALSPDQSAYAFDASGGVSSVTTSAREKFTMGTDGKTTVTLAGGETLKEAVFDAEGDLRSGILEAHDGAQWVFRDGYLVERIVGGNTTFSYDSSGRTKKVAVSGSYEIDYTLEGDVGEIRWADGSGARDVRTDSQGEITDAVFTSPQFVGAMPGLGDKERRVQNGVLSGPGGEVGRLSREFWYWERGADDLWRS